VKGLSSKTFTHPTAPLDWNAPKHTSQWHFCWDGCMQWCSKPWMDCLWTY